MSNAYEPVGSGVITAVSAKDSIEVFANGAGNITVIQIDGAGNTEAIFIEKEDVQAVVRAITDAADAG